MLVARYIQITACRPQPATRKLMPPTYVRYRVVAVSALMAILLYLDRFCISFAEQYIQEDLRLTDQQIGWMLSAFFWTYALAQVPSGWLTDRFGAWLMLTIYILLWSLFTGLTGLAAGFVVLLALRFGFGIGQAGAYPTSANLISKWIPFSGRGMASSVVAFGGRMGGAIAPLLTAILIVACVPLSTSSRLGPHDLLDMPRLCYELNLGRDTSPPAAGNTAEDRAVRVGAGILARFDEVESEVVDRNARAYAATLDNPERAAPATAQTLADTDVVAAALSRLLAERDLVDRSETEGLALPREAERLLARPPESLATAEVERLNRLLLEAVAAESIKKIYGAGWRYVMYIYGLVGVVVAGLYWLVVRDRPADHPRCNEAERSWIDQGRPQSAARPDGHVGAVPFVRMITSSSLWLSCLVGWCTNVGWVFLVTWLPRYLSTVHQVPIEQRGLMAFIPLLVGLAGTLGGGLVTDRMVRLVGLRWGRALPIALSRFVAMAAYVVAFFEPSPWMAVACFSVVAFSTDLGTGATWAFLQDVGGRYTGSVLGWTNMWGNLGAAVTPPILIWIVGEAPNQNWSLAFLTCAGAFAVAGFAALGMNAENPVAPEDTG